MTRTRRAAVIWFLGVVGAAMPTAAWAEAPAITHDAVGCIAAGVFPRLEARFDPAHNVSRGRLLFRPSRGGHWYWVAMRREAEAFVAILPKPTPQLKRIDYYIEVTATDFATARTQEHTPDVVSGVGACRDGKITAGSLGSASIVLEASPGAPAVPAGFSSVGIVSATAAATAAVAAGGAVAAGAAAGGGHGAIIALGIIGAGVAAAGAVAATASEPERPPDPATLDNDGDGFTPQQGDCNDANPALTPNSTGFDAVATFGRQGTLSCVAPTTSETTVTVRNLSCSALSVNVRFEVAGAGPCCSGAPRAGDPTTRTDAEARFQVGSGSSVTRVLVASQQPFLACCSFDRCCTVACSMTETITVETGAGSRAFTNNYGEAGDCPLCAGPRAAGAGCPQRMP